MIQINEFRITEDNTCLIVDVQIQDLEWFDGVVIDKILFYNQDYYLQREGQTKIEKIIYDINDQDLKSLNLLDSDRHVRLEISLKNKNGILSLSDCNNLCFIKVITDTTNAPNSPMAPCICSDEVVDAAVANLYPIYQNLMNGVKELANDCQIPQNFINSFLQFQAVETALNAGNYPLAVEYWNKFFSNGNRTLTTKRKCGCHG